MIPGSRIGVGTGSEQLRDNSKTSGWFIFVIFPRSGVSELPRLRCFSRDQSWKYCPGVHKLSPAADVDGSGTALLEHFNDRVFADPMRGCIKFNVDIGT